jgi:hypothetical protein
MINCVGCPLQLRTRAPELHFLKQLLVSKRDTQTCTFDTQMFVNPDTSGLPSSNNNSRNLVFTCVLGERVSNDSPIVSHNFLLLKPEFLKYYINNKYKQLHLRTMAESFEGNW